MSTSATQSQSDSLGVDSSADYPCQHGGPGELVVEQKKLFVLSYQHNWEQLQKQMGRGLPAQIIAAELTLLEELIENNDTMKSMVDDALMKYYFSLAVTTVLQTAKITEQVRMLTRCGIYIAMYLKHDPTKTTGQFWKLTNESEEVQKSSLHDMHLGLGQVFASDGTLMKLLNTQIPCQCLSNTFPALQKK